MSYFSQKSFPILLAILLGIGIILFAWRTVSFTGAGASFEKGDETEVSADDSWRDALKVIPRDSLTRLLGANAGSASSTIGVATTTTDLLGRELLTSYALAQKSLGTTPMTDAQTQAISDILAGKVMTDTDLKQYAGKDIIIIPTSTSTLITYQKELSKALANFSRKNTVNELRAVAEAMDTKDATKLAPLAGTVANLHVLTDTLLAMKAPQTVAGLHLFLIQNYTLVLSGVVDMQSIIDDPVIGLRGIAKYQRGMNMLTGLQELLKAGH